MLSPKGRAQQTVGESRGVCRVNHDKRFSVGIQEERQASERDNDMKIHAEMSSLHAIVGDAPEQFESQHV